MVCSTDGGEWRIVVTDGETKKARIISTGTCSRGPAAGETRRRLKIRVRCGREAQDSESLGEMLCDYERENQKHRET